MCLSPRLIINRHYLKVANNSKSGAMSLFGQAPDFYIKVDCGLCVECQKKRGNSWKTRLLDEYKYHRDCFPDDKVIFGTLTIAPGFMERFDTPVKCDKEIRKFLERYRKMFGCSFRHYITSEYGEKKGRLHFHFIGFRMLCNIHELKRLWPFGRVDMQTLKGPQGLTYVSGYITKIVKGDNLSDESIPFFIKQDKKTKVWVSPGLGKRYTLDPDARSFHSQRGKCVFFKLYSNGMPQCLPRYYYRFLFSPIDLARRKSDFLKEQFELPKPPFTAHKRRFNDLLSYVNYVKSIGGKPLLMTPLCDIPTDVLSAIIYQPQKFDTFRQNYESFVPNRETFINTMLYGK